MNMMMSEDQDQVEAVLLSTDYAAPDIPEELLALPKIKVLTGAMKAALGDNGLKTIHCTASSTIDDLHGDLMTEACVRDMARQAVSALSGKGMTIFLNHRYSVPEDVFGRTYSSQVITRANDGDTGVPIWDMDLDVALATTNERVGKTWDLLFTDQITLGVSIGAYITEYEFKDKDAGFWGGLIINKVMLVEASIVGIPANQRSWVQNGVIAIGKSLGINEKEIRKHLGLRKTEDLKETEMPPTTITLGENGTETITITTLTTTETNTLSVPAMQKASEVTANEAAPETESPAEVAADEASSEAPEGETSVEETALADAAPGIATQLAAGETPELEVILEALEHAAIELRAIRASAAAYETENASLRTELTQAMADRDFAAEIVEQIAKSPLGRKTQFQTPVESFRARFAGIYDEGFLKLIDETE